MGLAVEFPIRQLLLPLPLFSRSPTHLILWLPHILLLCCQQFHRPWDANIEICACLPCTCLGFEGSVARGFVIRSCPVETELYKQHSVLLYFFLSIDAWPHTPLAPQLPFSHKMLFWRLTHYFDVNVLRIILSKLRT